ncbi:MAG: hypothetical protein SGPRY_008809, partial [Prymnesium sp.]
ICRVGQKAKLDGHGARLFINAIISDATNCLVQDCTVTASLKNVLRGHYEMQAGRGRRSSGHTSSLRSRSSSLTDSDEEDSSLGSHASSENEICCERSHSILLIQVLNDDYTFDALPRSRNPSWEAAEAAPDATNSCQHLVTSGVVASGEVLAVSRKDEKVDFICGLSLFRSCINKDKLVLKIPCRGDDTPR